MRVVARGIGSYFRGTVGALGIALSGLMTLVGLAQLVRDESFWMWFCFAALALFGVSLFNYLRDYVRREAEGRSAALTDELLYRKCVVLGQGIQVFVSDRAQATPKLSAPKAVALAEGELPRGEHLDHLMAEFNHRQTTQGDYRKVFASDVFALVIGLRERGYVPESDTEWLNYPADLEGMKRVGERLDELGRRLKPKGFDQ